MILPAADWADSGFMTFNPIDYLHTANPDMKVFGLVHSYQQGDPGTSARGGHAAAVDIYDALQTANNANPPSTWWLLDRNGIRLKPWPPGTGNENVGRPNWQSSQYQSWISSYILARTCGTTQAAPAIVGMVSGSRRSCPVMLYVGANAQDADRNGQADWSETSKGRSWINSGFTGGMTTVIDNIQSDATFISDGGAVMLDGGWQYGSAGYNAVSDYAGYANIVQDYDFPTLPAYGLTCSSFWSSCPNTGAAPTGRQWDFPYEPGCQVGGRRQQL